MKKQSIYIVHQDWVDALVMKGKDASSASFLKYLHQFSKEGGKILAMERADGPAIGELRLVEDELRRIDCTVMVIT